MPSRVTEERINFGKIKEIIAPPNLIDVQLENEQLTSRKRDSPVMLTALPLLSD